jgi:hypothetical protein
MADVALQAQQSLEHRHFSSSIPDQNLDPEDAVDQQQAQDDEDIALQRQFAQEILNLPAEFLHPAYYLAGPVPRTDDANARYINGFGFEAYRHLIREDGTADNPTPGGCVCGDWLFYSYGCNHIYRLHRGVICGKTEQARPSIDTKCCTNHKKMPHIAKVKVLGPCGEVGCSWWSARFWDFDVLGEVLENDYNMDRVWPRRD